MTSGSASSDEVATYQRLLRTAQVTLRNIEYSLSDKVHHFVCKKNAMNPNQFMHQKRRLNDVGKSSNTIPQN